MRDEVTGEGHDADERGCPVSRCPNGREFRIQDFGSMFLTIGHSHAHTHIRSYTHTHPSIRPSPPPLPPFSSLASSTA